MYPLKFKCVILCCVLLFAASCAKAPHTQRSQFIMVPKSRTVAMGRKAAKKIKKDKPILHDSEKVGRVRRVGGKIAHYTDSDYKWEFNVIDKDKVNAFALPGGEVFVYRGLLEMTDSNGQLATVIAHEIAHIIARHGAERMSMQLGANLLGQAAGVALNLEDPTAARAFQQAYGIGAQVGLLLPYSRTQEYEADHIGLILMAKAGYNPEAAIAFWSKMMKKDKGEHPPVWLSTHPLSQERLREIKEDIPIVKSRYYK